ncbi:MAG TPA: SDR family NAD(P)-dependent oxidoreductase [Isosphaeraceae bacterium]|jgi:short-subunit dehydrogenase|nr:SDR family NAD(P)-dependent oxidoreductase [Isosphaeraceae bacterium]
MSGQARPVVLLTGAAQGIGRATATALAARGYRLALIDVQQAAVQELAELLRKDSATVAAEPADVSDREALRAAVVRLEAQAGPTDVAVACAGVGGLTSFYDLDMPGFRKMLEVNVLGVAQTIEAVLPGMVERKAGHIVGISSVASYRGLPWMASYCASKAAVATYLEGLRPILKRRGITITTVFPGFVRTGMTVSTPFRKPVKMLEPDQAARYLVRAIERRPRDYAFPPAAALGMGVLRRLPNVVFDWMIDRAGPQALTTDF